MGSVLPAIPYASPAALLAITLGNGGVDWRRAHVFGGMFLRYCAFEPLRLAERVAFDRAISRHQRSEDPVFVLGHWRSGTSFLQHLLVTDPRFATTTLHNTLLADVSTVTRPWLKPALDGVARGLKLPHNLQRVPLHFDLEGEADVGLCAQLSPYAYTWGHLFPTRFEAWLERCVLDPSPEYVEGWLQQLDRYMAKLSWASGGKRLVMKSPGDTGRPALLARHYPDARFVFIHRDPIAVFHSTRYLWSVIRGEFAFQTVTDEQVDAYIIDAYARVMRAYLAQRDELGDRLIEVAYADLVRDPVPTLRGIYDALGLGPLPDSMVRALAGPREYRPHRYETPPQLEQQLREAWAFAFEEWSRES